MKLLALMVEFVTDLVFGDDGGFTGKGVDDHELGGTIGYHFGFYSRPNDGARGVVLKIGGEGNSSILIAWRDKQYELALEKGECGMQNAFSASILLDKNSNIKMKGNEIDLGDGASDGVATKKDLQVLYSAISDAAVAANDGGATLQTNIKAALTTAGWSSGATDGNFCSSKIKAVR